MLALAHEGIAFDRMAVLLRSPQEYRSHLEEAFGRANVPVYFARGAVRPDPAGRAFHALLCCAAENLSARRFAEYLSLSQVPDAKPDGSPPEAAPRQNEKSFMEISTVCFRPGEAGPRFDANETGRQVRKPRCNASAYNGHCRAATGSFN